MSFLVDYVIPGHHDGPCPSDHYKRAIIRPAPRHFTVEFLPPKKFGGSYSYGMRIFPLLGANSISSDGSNFMEYDVWRRWEDCLWFQDNLELEYHRSSRQKRQRLLQGKGVKKNGFYIQDQASSWESLPPGPHPKAVALDIHEYIPKLTKRGTLFRPSIAIIEQRHAELQAFVVALSKEDQPTLIKEMRSTSLVSDFFGYWHRDATLTATFASNDPSSRTQVLGEMSTFRTSQEVRSLNGVPVISDSSAVEVPIIFDQGHQSYPNSNPRPNSGLGALPEEPIHKQTRLARRRNRNYQIYGAPPEPPVSDNLRTLADITALERSMQASQPKFDSASTYHEGLHIEMQTSTGCRQSMTSIVSSTITDSVEVSSPRGEQPFKNQVKPQAWSRLSIPVSLSDLELFEGIDSMHDASSRPVSTISLVLETTVLPKANLSPNVHEPAVVGPLSPTTSVMTRNSTSTYSSVSTAISSSSQNDDILSIRATLNGTTVIFRVSRDIEWGELRQRISNKFVGQQAISLSKDFTIAVVVAKMTSAIAQLREFALGMQNQSMSLTSVDKSNMRILDSQLDWETVAYSTEDTKLTLRIFDASV